MLTFLHVVHSHPDSLRLVVTLDQTISKTGFSSMNLNWWVFRPCDRSGLLALLASPLGSLINLFVVFVGFVVVEVITA